MGIAINAGPHAAKNNGKLAFKPMTFVILEKK